MTGRLHVVTGIPGTGIKAALTRLQHQGQARRVRLEFVSLEDHLASLAKPHVERLYHLPDFGLAQFLLPRPFLRELWSKAFDAAWSKATELSDQGVDVVLTLHLCYFHHGYREYLVPADFARMQGAFTNRVRAVVTLVDDIFDCDRRLTGSGEMLQPPLDAETALLDLLAILDWRGNELLLSDSLAAACRVPYYLFATKQPLSTLFDLLYTKKPAVYVSHPITEIRRLRLRGLGNEAQRLVNDLAGLVARLGATCVVFEPTAIDELRFRAGADGVLRGNLTDRWPFVGDERQLAYDRPSGVSSDWSFPVGWDADGRNEIANTPLLKRLAQAIGRQIGARDHWLVEQSAAVVCYRPLFEGHVSGGVKEELRHIARVKNLGVTGPLRALVFNPTSDRNAYGPRQFWEYSLKGWEDQQLIGGDPTNITRLRDDLRTEDVPETRDILNGNGLALKTVLERYRVRIQPRAGLLPDGALGTTEIMHVLGTVTALALELKDAKDNVYLDKLATAMIVEQFEDLPTLLEQLPEIPLRT